MSEKQYRRAENASRQRIYPVRVNASVFPGFIYTFFPLSCFLCGAFYDGFNFQLPNTNYIRDGNYSFIKRDISPCQLQIN